MTAATSAEYWPWSMMPRGSPNRAEMVPKVSPVDMRSVVYIASFGGNGSDHDFGHGCRDSKPNRQEARDQREAQP
jgi:hypothetical protein